MIKALEYYDIIIQKLEEIKLHEIDRIHAAGKLCFDAFKNGHSIYVFGASHAGILAEELYCRAGGLMIMNPVFNPTLMLNTQPFETTSLMERLVGFGDIIFKEAGIKKDDVLIVHSVSGRNSVGIDMAASAKNAGTNVVAITNIQYSKSVESRHPSGKRLFELADIVIDNHGDIGDASVVLNDGIHSAGPTSTVIGATIVNMLALDIIERCETENIEIPVFESANLKPDIERQKRLQLKYRSQIHYK